MGSQYDGMAYGIDGDYAGWETADAQTALSRIIDSDPASARRIIGEALVELLAREQRATMAAVATDVELTEAPF